jgi:NADPH:quinone reductase-like Zn-dependent oxidoreductase
MALKTHPAVWKITMKAVQFRAPGEPAEVLTCGTVDLRPPARGEVRVRMIASPVNPSDMSFIRGIYNIKPQYPQTPGFEGVGVVEHSGGGLRGKFFQGKRVVVIHGAGGNWASQAVVPASQVIPISRQLSDTQAATFMVNPITAWVMTREVLKIPAGSWLLQTAAGSQLGHMIARLGRHQGFKTLSVIRRAEHTDSLQACGSDAVVVFDATRQTPEELQQQVKSITGHDGVSYAIDPVGGATASAVVGCLGQGAKMLLYGTLSGQPISFIPRQIMQADATIAGFWLGNFMSRQSLSFKLRLVRRITALIQSGVLATTIGGEYPLENVRDAVLAAENQDVHGKILLRCNP